MAFANREVRIGKNFARGLKYRPRPEARGLRLRPRVVFKTVGTVFPNTDRPDLFPLNLTEFFPGESEWFLAVITARFSITCMNN